MHTSMWVIILAIAIVPRIMTLDPEDVVSDPEGFTLGKSEIRDIQDLHNELRRSEPASDMNYMKWNELLATASQAAADTCTEVDDVNNGIAVTMDTGVNTHYSFNNQGGFTPRQAIEGWHNPGKTIYHVAPDKCSSHTSCKTYLQIVWSRANQVGCGYKRCRSFLSNETAQITHNIDVFICQYSSRVEGLTPYLSGPACTRCSGENFWCDVTAPRGLCRDDCHYGKPNCACNVGCSNGGVVSCECTCQCVNGYSGPRCQIPPDFVESIWNVNPVPCPYFTERVVLQAADEIVDLGAEGSLSPDNYRTTQENPTEEFMRTTNTQTYLTINEDTFPSVSPGDVTTSQTDDVSITVGAKTGLTKSLTEISSTDEFTEVHSRFSQYESSTTIEGTHTGTNETLDETKATTLITFNTTTITEKESTTTITDGLTFSKEVLSTSPSEVSKITSDTFFNTTTSTKVPTLTTAELPTLTTAASTGTSADSSLGESTSTQPTTNTTTGETISLSANNSYEIDFNTTMASNTTMGYETNDTTVFHNGNSSSTPIPAAKTTASASLSLDSVLVSGTFELIVMVMVSCVSVLLIILVSIVVYIMIKTKGRFRYTKNQKDNLGFRQGLYVVTPSPTTDQRRFEF